MSVRVLLLISACVLLLINIILTILEAYHYYHFSFSSSADQGRIRGESDHARGRMMIKGKWYPVEWIIEKGVFNNEESAKK